MTRFGHLVLGPPGAGKTTYCQAMRAHLTEKGRNSVMVNLDPANDLLPEDVALDIRDLVQIEEVMEVEELGPNGALMFAMNYVATELDWLRERIETLGDAFLLIDLPGQVELFNNSKSLPTIILFLEKDLDIRLTAVHLVDSFYCAEPAKFISVLLSSLATMVHLEMPHINVLSKMDLMNSRGDLSLPLESFLEVMDLNFLLDCFPDDPFIAKHKELSRQIVSVVEDFSLVHFLPLDINRQKLLSGFILNLREMVEDVRSVEVVLGEADKANGFCYGSGEKTTEEMLSAAMTDTDPTGDFIDHVKDKFDA